MRIRPFGFLGINCCHRMPDVDDKLRMDQVFQRMIRMQLIITLAVGVVALVLSGLHGGISALAGGGSATIGSLLAWRIIAGNTKQDSGSALIKLLMAEAVKIFTIAVLLLLVFKFYSQLVSMALIMGLAGAAMFSGAAVFSMNKKLLV